MKKITTLLLLISLVSAETILKELISSQTATYTDTIKEDFIISSSNAYYLYGTQEDQYFGAVMNKNRGDFNGDGIDDFLILADSPDTPENTIHVVFGTRQKNLTKLSSELPRFVISYDDYVYESDAVHCDFIGDFNGDGFDDLVIGSLRSTSSGSGQALIILGNTTLALQTQTQGRIPNSKTIILTDSTNPPNPEAKFGFSFGMAGIGDINQDGFADLAIGNFNTDLYNENLVMPGRFGKVYVILGSRTPALNTDLNFDLNGANGFVVYDDNINSYSYFGKRIAALGDVNGDTIDDFIIGAPETDTSTKIDSGAAYIIFGIKNASFPRKFTPADLNTNNITKGVTIFGENSYDNLGSGVSGIGDINGDGLNDIAIGAPGVDRMGRTDAGEAAIIFGSPSLGQSIDLSDLSGKGFTILGFEEHEKLGSSFSKLGDLNFDGNSDFLVGTWRPLVIYGKRTGFDLELDTNLLDGENGFLIENSGSTSSGGVGDINGDSIPDYILGFPLAKSVDNLEKAGKVMVIIGSSLSQTQNCGLPYFCMAPPTGRVMNTIICGTYSTEVCVDASVTYDPPTQGLYDLKTQGVYDLATQGVHTLNTPTIDAVSIVIGVAIGIAVTKTVPLLITQIKLKLLKKRRLTNAKASPVADNLKKSDISPKETNIVLREDTVNLTLGDTSSPFKTSGNDPNISAFGFISK